jgi:hypothetical protein
VDHDRVEIALGVLSLLEAVSVEDGSILPRAILDVISAAQSKGEFLGDRATLLQRARTQTAGERARIKMQRLPSRRTANDALLAHRTAQVVGELRQAVIHMRRLCFQRESPPFRSLEDAGKWIEQRAEGWQLPTPADIDQRGPLGLHYWCADGSQGLRPVNPAEKDLLAIHQWARRISEQTSIESASLVAMVLMGAEPGQRVALANGHSGTLPGLQLVSLQRVSRGPLVPGDPTVRSERIVLEMDARDFTDRNLRRARQQFKTRLQTPTPRQSTRQQRVLDLVQKLGGPPKVKFDRRFWSRVARRLRITDPVAAARLYERAVESRQ